MTDRVLRGAAAAVLSLWLAVHTAAQERRSSPAAGEPPLTTIAETMRDSNRDTIPDRLGKRVHVRGVVTIGSGVIAEQRLQVYLQDETGGLYLFSPARDAQVPAGSLLDVVGTLSQYRGAVQIRASRFEIVGRRPLPRALPMSVKEAASWRSYGKLVTVEGVLGEPAERGPYIGSDLRGDAATIQVMMPQAVSRQFAVGSIPPGSRVSVTGVVSIYSLTPPHLTGFQLMVGSPSWLQVKSQPLPAWVTHAAIAAAAAAIIGATAFFVWRAVRRRARARRREVSTLSALSALAAGATDLDAFLADAVGLLKRNGVTDGAVIHLIDGKQLRLHTAEGIGSDKARLVDEEIQNRIGRRMNEPGFNISGATLQEGKGTSLYPLICVPLQGRSRMIGVLTGFTGTRHTVTAGEAGVFAAAANLIALGYENVESLRASEEKQRELQDLAISDPLTGLYNRRFMDEYLRLHLAMARRQNSPISFIAIDLDHFKQVNDCFGHEAGDQVLADVGEMIRATTRGGDLPVRLGGEEFLVVMPGTSEAGASAFADRLRINLRERPHRRDDEEIRITASIGIAVFPDHGAVARDLLRVADTALYVSKREGRDRVTVGGAAQMLLDE